MINRIFRLVAPKKVELCFTDETISDKRVYIAPTNLAICAADQRYYTGSRPKEVLDKKLPMALIHEAVGTVVMDTTGEYKKGDKVVMIPNTPSLTHPVIKENYLPKTKFRSSGYDGFMQSVVAMDRSRVIKLTPEIDPDVASFTEMLSIPFSAVKEFEKTAHPIKDTIGVWGDGNIGFVTALVLKKKYPAAKIYVMGKDAEKLSYFSFVDGAYDTDELPQEFKVDHAFECVGGKYSENAINQMIDYINPQGTMVLLGVSEQYPNINTRMVLEKGLTLMGSSRSGYEDFAEAVELMKDKEAHDYLSTIISETVDVKSIEDINYAFDSDVTNKFKTVMRWKI